MNKPFVNINDQGVSILAQRPGEYQPGKHNYHAKSVKVHVHHDLTLELHGEHFNVSTRLSPGEAAALVSLLGYALREALEVELGIV